MFWRSSEKYVVLQDHVPVEEQRAIARAVITVMPSEKPSQAFVERLSQDLVAEARQQEAARHQQVNQTMRLFGFLGGGLLSAVTGIVIWLVVRQDHKETGSELSLAGV
jgi:hypothetical protein